MASNTGHAHTAAGHTQSEPSITTGGSVVPKPYSDFPEPPDTTSEDSWAHDASYTLSDDSSTSPSQPHGATEEANTWSTDTTAVASDASGRRKSVQVVIQESDKTGRYTLVADDPEFREIMRMAIEREAARLHGTGRSRIRDLAFTQQFTTFDRQNPRGSQSPFRGFFTLFWLAMALLLIKIAAQNYKNQGSVFGRAEILHLMIDRDLVLMLATDAIMCLSTSFGYVLQKAIAKDLLSWGGSGWIIQSLWQMLFTVGVLCVSFYRQWPWTHTVFIFLHDFVLLMKQHSYSFYNGYLSQVLRRRTLLQQKLKQLDAIETHQTCATPPLAETTALDPRTPSDAVRCRAIGPKHSTNLAREQSDIALVAKSIEARQPLDDDQVQTFRGVLTTEITLLDEELRSKCTTLDNAYPNNLNLRNFIDWTCLPTLVYELEYPRQENINWWYVAEKSAATLGVIWIMIIISQAYIYPVVIQTVSQKEAGIPLEERWKEFPWVLSDMLFPLLLEQLLAWYVIWECVLNALAEITRFADRGFYGDWWNSVSWDQYARDWNRPVHNFLLRHVYHSSISAFHLSKMGATFVTFFLSAVVHELLMFCLFHKVRGYLFILQLSQVPLAALSKTRLMKGRDTLGNIIFWFGLFIGPSLLTSLYLIV